MNCSEMIVSEDIQDFIIEYTARGFELNDISDEVCFQPVNENWEIGYAKLPVQYRMNVSELGYHTIPKLYGLMDTTSMDASGITATLNQPFLNVAGQGTIIGIIDTGIDYTLDIFKFSPVDTKIGVIWDQTIHTTKEERTIQEQVFRRELEEDDAAYNYGTMYIKEQINEALSVIMEGNDPYEIVPSKDESGHGTYMAGIAAGNTVQNVSTDFTGAAPMAELAVVKLKPAKQYLRDYYLIKEEAEAYQENDIMLAVSFLLKYAQLRKLPLVIYIGLGTGSGPRLGATPLGAVLSDAAEIPNIVVVTAIGNEANERLHVFGRINDMSEPGIIEINVGEGERGFVMEVWASTQDVLSVSLVSPSGETIPRIPARPGSSNVFRFLLEGTEVSVDYRVVETLSGFELVFIRFDAPTPGIWRVNVYSITNIEGVYNAWMPIREFLSGDTFLLGASQTTTLLEPAAAPAVITVGAYDHITEAGFIDSSRGYTAQGQVKPDLVAPGVNVYGPMPNGGYIYRSGTSVAAAHVAGAAALLLCWGVYYEYLPFMGTNDVRYILIRGAKRDMQESYPNRIMGYGKLDLIESFRQLRVT
ncbi:MAG: S8 family peptidase [Lachnospira sp.]|nr:S8 family peptidase [Lachnospira sp.]